jgi:hypothetical protein
VRARAQVAIAFCSLNAHSHAKPRLKQINLPLLFTFDIATQRQDPEAPAERNSKQHIYNKCNKTKGQVPV